MGRHLPFSLPAPVRPSSAPWGAESASMTVRIETRRLRLRPFEAADAAAVEDCVGRWEIARMTTRIAHPYPKGAAAPWIAGTAAARAHDRTSVGSGKSVSVREEYGGRRVLPQKKDRNTHKQY